METAHFLPALRIPTKPPSEILVSRHLEPDYMPSMPLRAVTILVGSLSATRCLELLGGVDERGRLPSICPLPQTWSVAYSSERI
jgi:hypothetical protein